MSLTLVLFAAGLCAPQDPRPLPTLGVTLHDQRTLDPQTARIVRVVTDDRGRAIDGDALLRAEAAARGPIAPELRARMVPGARLPVVFWIKRDAQHPDPRAVLDSALRSGVGPEDARRAALEAVRPHVARLQEGIVEALRGRNTVPSYRDPFVPIVFATLEPAAIEALAARPDVDRVHYAFPDAFPETVPSPNDRASPTARTDAVHRRGVDGAGVKVLINDVGSMTGSNPYLPPITFMQSAGAEAHATAVAGILSSKHTTFKGAAPGLTQLFDAGLYGDQGAPQSWAWGMQQGISFGNCSWWNGSKGSIVFLDRYFDYIIRNFAVMLFKSCGNQGGGDNLTTTPGNGYNCIASGSADDRNTFDWNDDVIASYSSWVNPQPGHDKPEVSSPGTNINTTTPSSPWTGAAGSGTSYASPLTCGAATLLAATRAELKAKPEAIKALLMAGAWQNVEGDPRLSERDGAGGVDAAASQSAAAAGQYHAVTLTPGSFNNGVYTVPVTLVAGDETRIVAVWFSEADSSYATDTLKMDLDMVVERPGGGVVATSASTRNAFEIALFVPPVTGTYTVNLQRMRFDGTSEPFALAWTSRRDAATDFVTVIGTPTIGQPATLELNDPYHAGATYAGILSLTVPGLLPVSFNRVLEFQWDALSALSLSGAIPGFVGVLPANGKATATLPIPNDTSLRGLRVHAGMVTIDPAIPGFVEETSAVVSFVIQ
jgi:hypothetical protein